MGVPSVFHTPPPQPSSKARMIWPPEFAGGADASQKGFGETMHAQFVVRSGMPASGDECVDGGRGALALGHGVDHFLAAVGAVAAGVPARARRGAAFVDDDAAGVLRDPRDRQLRL